MFSEPGDSTGSLHCHPGGEAETYPKLPFRGRLKPVARTAVGASPERLFVSCLATSGMSRKQTGLRVSSPAPASQPYGPLNRSPSVFRLNSVRQHLC